MRWKGKIDQMEPSKAKIMASMQLAFLGAINTKIRLIAFDATTTRFVLYVYVDAALSECEYEAIDSAVTDVLADFPDFLSQKIEIIHSTDHISSLDVHQGCFFMRFEHQFE